MLIEGVLGVAIGVFLANFGLLIVLLVLIWLMRNPNA